MFGYENGWAFQTYASDQKFEDSVDLLLLIDNDKSHYVTDLCFTKQKKTTENGFVEVVYSVLVVKVSIKYKENCLSINVKQPVKLEKGIIEFKNYFKQIPVPFKIYADFECNLRGVEGYEGSYTKKISKSHSLWFSL